MKTMKQPMNYRVNEIFYSLQGEGYWTGTPVVFVRFSGCNLHCSFCDTSHESFTEMDADSILGKILSYPAKRVVFTGGEPLLQLDKILVNRLNSLGKYVHVETNGSIKLEFEVDWITLSPKENWKLRQGNELKVVYTRQDQSLLNQYLSAFQCNHYFLQPCSMQNTEEVVEICKRDPRWRLSLQTHKMIRIC